MAIVLDAGAVRLSTAALMAYRLRVGGFVQGRSGSEVNDFTADTTPTLARATEVTTRNAALVSDDFPGAEPGDEPELRTIAALRSAIELEASAPSMDAERIRVWRDQLREYVRRAVDATSGGAGGSEGEPGARVLSAVWDFEPGAGGVTLYDAADFAAGSEVPIEPRRRRLRW